MRYFSLWRKIIRRLKSWMRKVVKDGDEELVKRGSSRPSLVEEAAAEAAAEVACKPGNVELKI